MPTLIKNGKNYSGTSVSLTQAEYDALTETQKNDGTVYFITDSNAVLDASDVSVGSGTVEDSIGSIAVIETSPATSAHAVGTYLVYNGKLYKVTSAISANEQLVVGTNISATTVGDELKTVSATYGNGNIIAYRTGNVVFLRFAYQSTAFSKGWNLLATIDTIFRPRGTIDYVVVNNDATAPADYPLQVRINSINGSVSVYSFSAKNLAPVGGITYIV
jgi:hypothetical protein